MKITVKNMYSNENEYSPFDTSQFQQTRPYPPIGKSMLPRADRSDYSENFKFAGFGSDNPILDELRTGRSIHVGLIDFDSAQFIITLIHYLAHDKPGEKITLNVMSQGGIVHAGLAIIDAARNCSCPIETVGYGLCASMGAMILACAAPQGSRFVLPNTEVLVHQVLSGVQGQQTDIQIEAEHLAGMRRRLDQMLADASGKTVEEITRLTERDSWLSAEEAVEMGIVDTIIGN